MILLAISGSAQLYDNLVVSDKKDPDSDNQLYTAGRIFTYAIESATESSNELPKRILYTVVDLPKSKRTNKKQTEVVISYEPDKRSYENTGIVENASNIWLHPPRTGPFTELETCPFPYAKLPLTIGAVWKDQLSVGERWAQGLWEGRMLFNIEYKVTRKQEFAMDNIKYDCWVIESTARSEVGSSQLVILYHEEKGFMQLSYTTLGDKELALKLENTVQGPIYQSMDQYFADKLKAKN